MKKITIVFSLLYIITASCKKDYLDINENPNNATNTTPELVFPNALNVTAARQINSYTFISGWMGQWAKSGSYAPSNTDFTTYKETSTFGEGLWGNIFNNLEDYQYVIDASAAQSKLFYQGAAEIMEAYEFQQLVDMFGNIPYTDALKGTVSISPQYSDATEIYPDLINKIDTGISLLKADGGLTAVSSSNDIMFSGDITSWIQFANTLKLRILMRQSEKDDKQSYIKSEVASIVSEGSGFLTTDASVNPGYINSAGKQNPFWSLNYSVSGSYSNDFWRANQFGIDFYKTNDTSNANYDPRGRRIYAPTPGDNNLYQGNYIGEQGYVGGNSSIFGPGVLVSVDQSAIILTAAESYFLQCEAAVRGYLTDDAQQLYQAGIVASFETYTVDDADNAAMAYYSNPSNTNVFWSNSASTSKKLDLIITQKWAAENTITPFEEWCDYRRLPNSNFNRSIPLSKSNNVDQLAIPVRILYPTSEYTSNAANVEAQDQSNNAHHTDKIFWMP